MLDPPVNPLSRLHPIEREKVQLQKHIEKIKQIIFTNPYRHHMQDWVRDKHQGAIDGHDRTVETSDSFGADFNSERDLIKKYKSQT
jgi:hypothetical protein